jgi:hypothetical protein
VNKLIRDAAQGWDGSEPIRIIMDGSAL